MILAWFLLQIALVVAAVQLMDRSAWRRAASIFMLIAALLLPLYVPSGPLPRALLSSLALLALVKILQIARQPRGWSPAYRLWHALAPFDVDQTQHVSRSLDRKLLSTFALHAVLAAVALLGLFFLPRNLPLGLALARLLLGGLLVYTGMEAVTTGVRLVHLLFGVAVPPIQQMPILSLSIREFWSRRWNKPVSKWLNEFVFIPVTRQRSAEMGVLAAFSASAILHAWMFFTAAGWLAALMAGTFFLFQGLFVLVESVVHIRRLPELMRRLWTIGMLSVSSPLFVEPVLRVLGL